MGKLTDKQKIDIINLYMQGIGCVKISKIFNVTPNAIVGLLKRRGIELRRCFDYRTYSFNPSCFDNVTEENQSYWLGFLMADGSVQKKDYSLILEISNKDIDHLHEFKNFLQAEQPIKFTRKNCSSIKICSKKLYSSLSKHGIVPRKTNQTKTPIISPNLLRHFYRGVFDGDGWVTSRFGDKKTGYRSWEICYSSGTHDFLKEIHTWVCTSLGETRGYIIHRQRKNQSVYELHFGGNIIFPKVVNLLYKDATVFLTRKHNLIQNALNKI